jgi:hypothetical protein
MTEAKMEALRKANEARLRKRILEEERRKAEELENRKKEIESYVLETLKKHYTATPEEPPVKQHHEEAPPQPRPQPQFHAYNRPMAMRPMFNDRAERAYRMIFRR